MDFKQVIQRGINKNINTIKNKNIDCRKWLHITYDKNVNNKIIYLNGQNLTEELEELEKSQEYINWQMSEVCNSIEFNMYKYCEKYDELHGEGAYDRRYYLPPIYPNLDLESDAETDLDLETDETNDEMSITDILSD